MDMEKGERALIDGDRVRGADREWRKVPDYQSNELRPNQRNPLSRDGEGREGMKYAQGVMSVGDFNDNSDYPAQSPASATWTPGLPSRSKSKAGDEGHITLQPGIPRVR